MFQLDIKRFWALMVREFHTSFLSIIKIIAVIVSALYILLTLFSIGDNGPDESDMLLTNFGLMFLIAGFIYASLSFGEFRKDSLRAEYLVLPGSSLEKVLSKWVFTNPLYIITISAMFYLLSLIFLPVMNALSSTTYENGIFTTRTFWILIGLYFILHSIFFLGSVVFNKLSLIKTLLVLIIIALFVALVNGLWFRIVWADMFIGLFDFSPNQNGQSMRFGVNYQNPNEMPQIKFFIFLFKYIMAPVLWVVSIFKLSEKEL